MFERLQAAKKTGNFFSRSCHYLYGKILFAFPSSIRGALYRGKEFFCPVCQTNLRKFIPLYRPYHRWCPVCKSLSRHRFVWHYFNSEYFKSEDQDLKILHIAPENAIQELLEALPNAKYISADLNEKRGMVKMDVCDIHYPDESFDLIFCSHVLEHVKDDRVALAEFRRVLSSRGKLLLMVPIMAEVTFEDPEIVEPAERERVFGQLDHVRAYGKDFSQIVTQVGFNVTTFQPSDFVNSAVIRVQGLDPEDRLFVCTK